MGSPRHRLTEAKPVHDEREIEAVLAVLRSGTLDDLGPNVAEFEQKGAALLAKQMGVTTKPLPGGAGPCRLYVIVGPARGPGE